MTGSQQQSDDTAVAVSAEHGPVDTEFTDQQVHVRGHVVVMILVYRGAPPVPAGIGEIDGEMLGQMEDGTVEYRMVLPVSMEEDEGLSAALDLYIDLNTVALNPHSDRYGNRDGCFNGFSLDPSKVLHPRAIRSPSTMRYPSRSTKRSRTAYS